MIYQIVEADAPIRQGDIIRNVPRIELSLSEIPIVDDDGQRIVSWNDILSELSEPATDVTAIVTMRAATGIVVTQDCDAARGESLCLALIADFGQVTNKSPETPKSWWKLITNHTRSNLRYFYLPADTGVGFDIPMAADFRTILRIPLKHLLANGASRVGRLNSLAYEHFRESLAQFFRRYPYNEWYPLTKEQFQDYSESITEERPQPYDWQK